MDDEGAQFLQQNDAAELQSRCRKKNSETCVIIEYMLEPTPSTANEVDSSLIC